ncbi:MAG: response regulator transcription factor [Candidatus Kaiserbacteria bacterium]|nr:response regulator transcription factor [Candidatus Kaiserbacteria bacterium]
MTDNAPTILIVDDDKFLLDMYTMKFTKEGFVVHACLSVNDAIDVLRGGFKADAIVFDLTMPERDGYSFLQSLRDEHLAESAKKIALTNQNSDGEKAKAMELGADDYLIKATMIPSEVVAHVRGTIGKSAH